MTACAHCLGLGAPNWRFKIDAPLASQNRMKANTRFASSQHSKELNEWVGWIALNMKRNQISEATGRRVVRITREFADGFRNWDYGNLVGGLKTVVDAMTAPRKFRNKWRNGASLIVDDNAKYFIDIYEQRKAADGLPGVVFEVWEYPSR